MIWMTCCLLSIGGVVVSTVNVVSASSPIILTVSDEVRVKFDKILSEVPKGHFFPADNMRKLLDKYSPAELQLIYKDFCEIREQTFHQATKQLDYVVTAGSPGAGKSTVLERLIEGGECPDESLDKRIIRAYIDPDRSCLLRMKRTYKADIALAARTPQKAYEHWRDASNFLSNVYLAIALKEGYAIAHGSTMATPYAKNALNAIKNLYGYRTTVVHMTCDEDVRKISEEQRRKSGVVQCTDKDFVEKQAMFLTLLADYLKFSDNVLFCYRGSFDKSTWAAKVEKGSLVIYDEPAFVKIQETHDAIQGSGFWKKTFPFELLKITKNEEQKQ